MPRPTLDLSAVPVVDNHIHPIAEKAIVDPHFQPFTEQDAPARREGLQPHEFEQLFSLGGFAPDFLAAGREGITREEWDDLRLHGANTLLVYGAILLLARFLGCDATAEEVTRHRNARVNGDYAGYVRDLFADARLTTVLVDDGWPQPPLDPTVVASNVAPARARRVFRIEPPLQTLLDGDQAFAHARAAFRDALHEAAAQGCVAYKSVIAYRTGLDIGLVEPSDAARALDRYRREGRRDAAKTLRDFFLAQALEVAMDEGIFLHVHTGIGDPDLLGNPVHPFGLIPLLIHPPYRRGKVVLIHGGYPWVAEAAYLTNVLPNVYLDFSVTCPHAAGGLRQRLLQILETAPVTKVLYASDGLIIPEIPWVGARLAKKALGEVLWDLVDDGLLDEPRAYDIAHAILHGNAERIYRL